MEADTADIRQRCSITRMVEVEMRDDGDDGRLKCRGESGL